MLLGGSSHCGCHRRHRIGWAELGIVAYADFGPGAEAVLDDGISNVGLGDADGGQQHGGQLLVTLGVLATIGVVNGASGELGGVSAIDERNCQCSSGFGFGLDTLVNGHALLTRKYALDAFNCGILTG